MLNISLISIGDEILIGQIINTNAAWLANKLTEHGWNVFCHHTVSDKSEPIKAALDQLISKSDVIIITGGLGPTNDDITKNVLAEYFNTELVISETVLEQVKAFFKLRNRQMTKRNESQVMIPANCIPLINTAGTAPGMFFNVNRKYIFSLPGVPFEMQTIAESQVFDIIKSLSTELKSDIVKYKSINTSGVPESVLADMLEGIDDLLSERVFLAYLPSTKGVRLRIGARADDYTLADKLINEVEVFIKSRAGKYIHSVNVGNLSDAVIKLLISKGLTLSVAESCTGGMLGAELTSIAGSSNAFLGGMIVYSNEAKIEQLNVMVDTIEQYGAVSKEVAIELADSVRIKFSADFGISIAGISGPSGASEGKPIGTTWIAISSRERTISELFSFGGDRRINRERAVFSALSLLFNLLNEDTL